MFSTVAVRQMNAEAYIRVNINEARCLYWFISHDSFLLTFYFFVDFSYSRSSILKSQAILRWITVFFNGCVRWKESQQQRLLICLWLFISRSNSCVERVSSDGFRIDNLITTQISCFGCVVVGFSEIFWDFGAGNKINSLRIKGYTQTASRRETH